MTDQTYVRGWDDCLEAVSAILEKAKTVEEAKERINKLRKLIQQDKFEKIRCDLGVFGLF
ncbi:hypothetical protein [Candidatus Bathycorpusculum sp.]|uniref:hypothetical protein n=1 Tax=Candidatus Bathycorpusculum sp. TaxID=2994959 RepID=UPI0028297150|nr:hypothetical protein [Candidatus Termitimicrobium sp.]